MKYILEAELKSMGFRSFLIENIESYNVYIKVYFSYLDKDSVRHADGTKEFTNIGNWEEAISYINRWVLEEKGFEIVTSAVEDEYWGGDTQ